jgi:hypothetical protein
MSDKTGGPAFPVETVYHHNGQIEYGTPGMTLRDWFAGQALNGWLSTFGPDDPLASAKEVAIFAYGVADAMIAARGEQ